ncbi:hypothetical protein KAK07_10115 [Ideonella sp. 4Y16]|uniref:Lipoprotein n=1 Tax=Ideonella alba TaxID=2824118 RepID=A0A940YF99_9BURK|nr:hypothetical protein [Ideonella alba]MBQ0932186.1 hypothetical protein [Ideonella alba]MBQ0943691.1 hypothetical protein [Ideonella alba]
MNVKQSFLRGCSVLALAALLAGCSKIPLSSLWALRGLQFADVDAAALRALLWLPEGVDLAGGALTVRVKVERGNGRPDKREMDLHLTPLSGAAATHGLSAPRAGGRWLALGLPADEQQRLAELRREMQAWRDADGPDAKRTLGLGAELNACSRARTPPPPAEVAVDAWLRWKPGQSDLRLLDGATLADLQPDGAPPALPRC